MPSPFDALIDDLMAVQATRTTQPLQRDTVSRIARHAAEAQRNRRLVRATVARPMAKAAPPAPAPAPDFDRIARQQAQLETAMRDTAARAERDRQARVKADCRAVIADLRHAARRGELPAAAAAKLDAMIGQAARMGLTP